MWVEARWNGKYISVFQKKSDFLSVEKISTKELHNVPDSLLLTLNISQQEFIDLITFSCTILSLLIER